MIHWLMVLYGVKTTSGLIAALTATIGLIATIFHYGKKTTRGVKESKQKFNNIYESVVGSEAIVDPETGKVLREARPALGTRVAAIEVWQRETANALTLLASNQETTLELKTQIMESLEERDKQGMLIIEEWTKWRDVHKAEKDEVHRQLWEAIGEIRKVLEDCHNS